ncbi:unnamed protein product [Cuscuta campestris]|uniref:Arginyl-tRNA--protein transferase n=2 Tax=Cuscuta sect. Cleistogrammica TaxID=1824901 RepID=A0A484NDJ0_9ASTE|nr:hypothetical protein DM860_003850 [Cuscuta australis]VFQ99471.1 unnamed protein product [Cuscuta campestris]
MAESVVVDYGSRNSSCGYCKSGGPTSASHGLMAIRLSVDDYQALLDRGWRRSGCYLYKPEMESTCCPSYTIRIKADDFVPSKEQCRVTKRMERFLEGILSKQPQELMDSPTTSEAKEPHPNVGDEKNHSEQFMHYLSEQIDNSVQTCVQHGEIPSDVQLPKASIKKVSPATKRKLSAQGVEEELLFTSNISFQIVSVLRRTKNDSGSGSECSAQLTANDVAEKLSNRLNQLKLSYGFATKACNGHINFFSSSKCLNPVNAPESEKAKRCTKRGYLEIKRHRLEIRLKRSTFDPEEYSLYRRYQLRVHNDEPDKVTESSYRRFLVDTPLVFVPPTADRSVPLCGFGSFHQQYLIDGQLVAVGVIDILPKCLSSKYLFWDPDFAFLSLGKYSAQQEIRWVKENQVHCPSLQYYYLGYYIHSCHKMRYKAAYRPSELLCPLRYTWVPYEIVKPLLDRKPCAVLSDYTTQDGGPLPPSLLESNAEEQCDDQVPEGSNDVFVEADEEMAEFEFEDSDDDREDQSTSGTVSGDIEDGDVGGILVGLNGTLLRFEVLQQAFGPKSRQRMTAHLQKYRRIVGRELSEKMVYSLD